MQVDPSIAPPERIYLVTDASKVGVGSFICHGKNYTAAKSKVAAMHSRKFTPAQCNYTTTDQELLAIVDALKTFEHRLLGVKFTIVTDHMALRTLLNRKLTNQRQIRWVETINMFDFEIEHIAGTDNVLADTLSRIYEDVPEEEVEKTDFVSSVERDWNSINTGENSRKTEYSSNTVSIFPSSPSLPFPQKNLEEILSYTILPSTPRLYRENANVMDSQWTIQDTEDNQAGYKGVPYSTS